MTTEASTMWTLWEGIGLVMQVPAPRAETSSRLPIEDVLDLEIEAGAARRARTTATVAAWRSRSSLALTFSARAAAPNPQRPTGPGGAPGVRLPRGRELVTCP